MMKHIRKTLSILLAAMLLLTAIPIAASADYNLSRDITGINETRNTDDLIIYNTRGSYSGTNVWGYEVVVTQGVVSSVGGNNNYIDDSENSFVVSGHGEAMDWLSANVVVGMKCTYSTATMKVSFVFDGNSLIYSLNNAKAIADEACTKANDGFYVYNSGADAAYAAANDDYDDIINAYDSYSTADESEINALVTEYTRISDLFREIPVSSYRGVWIRPTQTSAAEVDAYVQRCYDAGINMISIETMYNGTMVMPMPEGSLFEQNPTFGGFDMVTAYINSCHTRGMELHLWMPVFYSCSTGSANYSRSPVYKKPAWRCLTDSGSALYSGETSGMVFLNPALPEVRDFLLSTYEYILRKYDIDGFQLDYIRYRDRTANDDYGYNPETIALFKQTYPEYAGYTISYNKNAAYWNDWVAFRAAQVTQFVGDMRKLVDCVAPDVLLTADVGPDSATAYSALYQDGLSWLRSGWLDMLHPMAYGDGYASKMGEFTAIAGERCMVVPGLGIFMENYDADDMRRQTKDMLDIGCDGVVFFQIAQYLSKDCGTLLNSTIFNTRALCPSIDKKAVLLAQLDRMLSHVAKAGASGVITASLKSTLESQITAAKNAAEAGDAYAELTTLENTASAVGNASLRTMLLSDVDISLRACERIRRDASALLNFGEIKYIDDEKCLLLGFGKAEKTASELAVALSGAELKKSGTVVGGSTVAGTGWQLENSFVSFKTILCGDINGNGAIDATDYSMLKRSILDTLTLDAIQTAAGSITGGEISTIDYMKLKRHVLGTFNIYG